VPRNLLQAARRLLDSGGFGALRLEAIAAQAGEPKGSVAYYFGNKAGLIAALVDYLAHDAVLSVIRATEGLPVGEQRIHALIGPEEHISSDVQGLRAFFEILPHVLRDPNLRARIARLYSGYREASLHSLGADDEETQRRLLPYAMATVALIDGLAIQYALDPEIDISLVARLWEELLKAELRTAKRAPRKTRGST